MARMNATLVFAIMRVAVLNMLPNLVMKSDSKKLGSNLILGRLRATIFGYINILNVIFFRSGWVWIGFRFFRSMEEKRYPRLSVGV